jgi:hypothetical protein
VGEWRTKTKIRITLIDVRDILYELWMQRQTRTGTVKSVFFDGICSRYLLDCRCYRSQPKCEIRNAEISMTAVDRNGSYRIQTRRKLTVFWDVASCSLVETDRRFRGAYCHHHRGEAARENAEAGINIDVMYKLFVLVMWTFSTILLVLIRTNIYTDPITNLRNQKSRLDKTSVTLTTEVTSWACHESVFHIIMIPTIISVKTYPLRHVRSSASNSFQSALTELITEGLH